MCERKLAIGLRGEGVRDSVSTCRRAPGQPTDSNSPMPCMFDRMTCGLPKTPCPPRPPACHRPPSRTGPRAHFGAARAPLVRRSARMDSHPPPARLPPTRPGTARAPFGRFPGSRPTALSPARLSGRPPARHPPVTRPPARALGGCCPTAARATTCRTSFPPPTTGRSPLPWAFAHSDGSLV